MTQPTDIPYHLRELFPSASLDLLRLFQAAEENASVLVSDFHTVRDWLEIAGYDQETLHVLLLLLILGAEEGSLCLELTRANLARRLGDLAEGQAETWAERILADLEKDPFPRLIGATADDPFPVILYREHGRAFLYFQKFLRHEIDFAREFRRRLEDDKSSPPANQDKILQRVLEETPLLLGDQPLQLDRDQRQALDLALTRNLVLISGGPGTGKTSIVLTLLRCLVRTGLTPDKIALAAPTGRAAQRLSDAIRLGLETLAASPADSPDFLLNKCTAGTLHQLLGYMPHRDQFRRHAENPVAADVVIVDEVSMVGLVLMSRLFQALRSDAKLILLGDKDQLPSVDAGAVLANLIPDETLVGRASSPPLGDAPRRGGLEARPTRGNIAILRTNHRSQAHIREIARAVNLQQTDVLEKLPRLELPTEPDASWERLKTEAGCRFLEQTSQTPQEMRRILHHWADYAFIASGFVREVEDCVVSPDGEEDPGNQARLQTLFGLLEQTRLLTLVRDGPWGCDAINRFLAQYLGRRLEGGGRSELFAGVPVLVTRNDPGSQLYNGDVGLTLRDTRGGLRVVFPRQGSFLSFTAEALPAHELGFALTVHKSQGSEYGQVLLVFPPSGGRRLLTKELVYTGITRAKQLAILCATPEVLRLAVKRRCSRESGLLRFENSSSP